MHSYQLLSDSEVVWTPARGGAWVAPRHGVLHDPGGATRRSPALAAALVAAAGLPLLEVPPGVAALMAEHMVCRREEWPVLFLEG